MTSPREQIVGRIREALGRAALSADAEAELDARLRAHRANLLPERARRGGEERLRQFVEMAEAAAASVARVPDLGAVPGAVADYLAEHNLATELVAAPDARIDDIPWDERPLLKLRRGRAEEGDAVSLTPAFAGVAETGTLMLTSGPDTPTTLGFLPENHIVVLRASEIVGAFEEAWDRLRKRRRRGRKWAMPRTVNMITGPSRSGDIGLELLLGAHGPRRLHIVLVEDEAEG